MSPEDAVDCPECFGTGYLDYSECCHATMRDFGSERICCSCGNPADQEPCPNCDTLGEVSSEERKAYLKYFMHDE